MAFITCYCLQLHYWFKQTIGFVQSTSNNMKNFLVILTTKSLISLINIMRKTPIVNQIGNKINTKYPKLKNWIKNKIHQEKNHTTYFSHQSLVALIKLIISMPAINWVVMKFDAKFPKLKTWLKRQIYKGKKYTMHIQLPNQLSTNEINMFMMKLQQEIAEQKRAKGEANL